MVPKSDPPAALVEIVHHFRASEQNEEHPFRVIMHFPHLSVCYRQLFPTLACDLLSRLKKTPPVTRFEAWMLGRPCAQFI